MFRRKIPNLFGQAASLPEGLGICNGCVCVCVWWMLGGRSKGRSAYLCIIALQGECIHVSLLQFTIGF